MYNFTNGATTALKTIQPLVNAVVPTDSTISTKEPVSSFAVATSVQAATTKSEHKKRRREESTKLEVQDESD